MSTAVELRCPDGMGKLLGKAHPAGIDAAGLIELACNNCARAARRDGARVQTVLHTFNLLGELVATEVVPTP